MYDENMLQIVTLRLSEQPKVEFIENSAEAFSRFVGGKCNIVRAFYPEDSRYIRIVKSFYNYELDMWPNRVIWHGLNNIRGNAFLVGYHNEKFVSLNDEQIELCCDSFCRTVKLT
jgi:hypothetical protein